MERVDLGGMLPAHVFAAPPIVASRAAAQLQVLAAHRIASHRACPFQSVKLNISTPTLSSGKRTRSRRFASSFLLNSLLMVFVYSLRDPARRWNRAYHRSRTTHIKHQDVTHQDCQTPSRSSDSDSSQCARTLSATAERFLKGSCLADQDACRTSQQIELQMRAW